MNEFYAHFDAWKDIDRFYFIPLKRDTAYSINGYHISMADEPFYLGSFVHCTLEHQDLFSFPCPHCGKRLYPYSYNGSPLSGRVDLEAECPDCGWKGYEMVSGWHIRSQALKATQKTDRLRLLKAKLLHPGFKPTTIEELLKWMNPQ